MRKRTRHGAGDFNSSTVIGQAIAPPALVLMQLAWGWRTMFVIIGVAGIPGWDLLVRVVSQPGAVCPDRGRTDISLRAG